MELLLGVMVENTLANGKMENNMEKEYSLKQMERKEKESG
jgi:predicted GIY-YIG superfamily endonuclease